MPLEQVSNALTFYAFFTASGVGKVGLSVTVDVWRVDNTGASTEIVTGAAVTEIGDGFYRYVLAASLVTVEGEYLAVFKTTDATVDAQHLSGIWVVGAGGIEVLTASLAVTYLGPVAQSGDITIVRGDDYNNTDGRALEWSTSDASTWPDLTGATISFKAAAGTNTLTQAGSVVTATGANKKVRVELTAAQTAALKVGEKLYNFDVQAALANGRKVTLVTAKMTVRADYAA